VKFLFFDALVFCLNAKLLRRSFLRSPKIIGLFLLFKALSSSLKKAAGFLVVLCASLCAASMATEWQL